MIVQAAPLQDHSKATRISRRHFMKAALAVGATPFFPRVGDAAAPGRKRLIAGTRILEVNGKSAKVFRLTGPNGRPGLSLAPREQFRVDLVNEAGGRTLVHWHGQLPPWRQDGFPWPQTPPIANGAVQAYGFAPIPGTYWMHSHHEMQEQNLMTAPLIVHTDADLREDRQEVILMLHDFTFRTPEEVLAGLRGADIGDKAGMFAEMPGMSTTELATLKTGGMQMDLNDVQYDAFLANDRTLADPEIIRVERGGRIRLRIINGASSSQFWVDLGEMVGRVVAADGHPVHSVSGSRFPVAMAQRLDILIDLPKTGAFPILAQVEGKPQQTGIVLATAGAQIQRIAGSVQAAPPVDNSLEARLTAVQGLSSRPVDIHQTITLDGSMKPYAWSMNGEHWPDVTPMTVTNGQRVTIEMVNHTMMAHPMHLHGHAFQVTGLNGTSFAGAVRDTVLVPPRGSVTIAFDADNPGRWAFHCHNLYHMMTGMMTELRYPGIV